MNIKNGYFGEITFQEIEFSNSGVTPLQDAARNESGQDDGDINTMSNSGVTPLQMLLEMNLALTLKWPKGSGRTRLVTLQSSQKIPKFKRNGI